MTPENTLTPLEGYIFIGFIVLLVTTLYLLFSKKIYLLIRWAPKDPFRLLLLFLGAFFAGIYGYALIFQNPAREELKYLYSGLAIGIIFIFLGLNWRSHKSS